MPLTSQYQKQTYSAATTIPAAPSTPPQPQTPPPTLITYSRSANSSTLGSLASKPFSPYSPPPNPHAFYQHPNMHMYKTTPPPPLPPLPPPPPSIISNKPPTPPIKLESKLNDAKQWSTTLTTMASTSTITTTIDSKKIEQKKFGSKIQKYSDYLIEEIINEEEQQTIDINKIKLPTVDDETRAKKPKAAEMRFLNDFEEKNKSLDKRLNQLFGAPAEKLIEKIENGDKELGENKAISPVKQIKMDVNVKENKETKAPVEEPYDPEIEYQNTDNLISSPKKLIDQKNKLDAINGQSDSKANQLNKSNGKNSKPADKKVN